MIHDNKLNLHSLLSQNPGSWGRIYSYIQQHPLEAKERYYRNESPLQLALKVNDRKWNRGETDNKGEGSQHIERIHVLQTLVDADPTLIRSRDEEGRTCLHTACSSGRSEDILQWLLQVEEARLVDGGSVPDRSVTLRTDYPGGALPLHLIASCNAFDTSSTEAPQQDASSHPINRYLTCNVIKAHTICAYNATMRIFQARPQAIWDRDCEGEIPLHAAASHGSVGSVLALLIGVTAEEATHGMVAQEAPLVMDDGGKTPLDRACEQVCSVCVPSRESCNEGGSSTRRQGIQLNRSLRRSIDRDDPFPEISNSTNSDVRRPNSARRRIPGCGSSFRSSFRGPVLDIDADCIVQDSLDNFRASFVSPRAPVDPLRALKALDEDGEEEFAKVELLARAAFGCLLDIHSKTKSDSPGFQLLHAVVALGCKPEIVYHAAMKNPRQVIERDEFGRLPLLIACEGVAALYHLWRDADDTKRVGIKHGAKPRDEGEQELESGSAREDIYASFAVPFLLCNADHKRLLHQPAHAPQQPTQSNQPSHSAEVAPSSRRGRWSDRGARGDLTEQLLSAKETIELLLHSSHFGQTDMANAENAAGRLPLHIVLEAGLQWDDEGIHTRSSSHPKIAKSLVRMLVEASSRTLMVRDQSTELYPFMLAATPKKLMCAGEDGEESQSTKQLETVYQLLLNAPSAVA